MAEYLVQDTSLISIGDKVRVLSGMKDPMSLNTMRDKIEAASNEVVTQSGLINQVKETLLEKINAGAIISTATITPTSNSTSINFTGVTDTPVYFCVTPIGNTALNRTTRYALNVVYDGNSTIGIYSTTTTATYTTNGYSWTYSNGTLNVKSASTSNGGYFKSGTSYQLTYVTLPSITTDATYSSSISPSSNSTSISFSGLTSEPKYFAIIPTSNTTLSSSTRYALNVVYDGNSTIGVYSNNSTATYTGFSWTYSNGTLTVKTASTSNGGYFRSGAEHKLIYVAAKSGSGNGSVSIENNTEGLQDIIQLMDNMPSGMELNFEVVGGTTEPSNPTENMIWVNTDVQFSNWVFSSVEPLAPSEGLLWIVNGSSSSTEFNILKENCFFAYPKAAKQYINDEWQYVVAKIYQDGNWLSWDKYLFYYSSQDYSWYESSMPAAIASNQSGCAPSISKNDNGSVTVWGGSSVSNTYVNGIYMLNGAFDFTNVDRLIINVEENSGGTATVIPTWADAWSGHAEYGGDMVVGVDLNPGDVILDTSGISGTYLFGIGIYKGSYFTLNSIKIVESLQ